MFLFVIVVINKLAQLSIVGSGFVLAVFVWKLNDIGFSYLNKLLMLFAIKVVTLTTSSLMPLIFCFPLSFFRALSILEVLQELQHIWVLFELYFSRVVVSFWGLITLCISNIHFLSLRDQNNAGFDLCNDNFVDSLSESTNIAIFVIELKVN